MRLTGVTELPQQRYLSTSVKEVYFLDNRSLLHERLSIECKYITTTFTNIERHCANIVCKFDLKFFAPAKTSSSSSGIRPSGMWRSVAWKFQLLVWMLHRIRLMFNESATISPLSNLPHRFLTTVFAFPMERHENILLVKWAVSLDVQINIFRQCGPSNYTSIILRLRMQSG